MTEDPPKKDDDQSGVDDSFEVKIPDELLEDAVEAVERRAAEAEVAREESRGDDVDPGHEVTAGLDLDLGAAHEMTEGMGEDVAVETTQPEGVDIEAMSIDDLLASGMLPEKVTTSFNELRAELMQARGEAREARESLTSSMTEAERFRGRVTREKNEALKFASEAVLKEVLPVFDNLERALAHSDSTTAQATVRDGVEITLRQFWHILQKLGVTKVDSAKGIPFDPHVHEAVAHHETAEYAPNSVAVILQSGFMLHDRLLRPAMVSVAKAPPSAPKPAAAAEPPAKTETAEEKLERVRRTGAAAREARQKKRDERAAAPTTPPAAAEPAVAVAEPVAAAPTETAEQKLERIRRAGAAARDARQKKRDERAAAAPAEAAVAAAPEPVSAPTAETADEKLERIRRAGAAARDARQKKRDERAAAPTPTPTPAPTATAGAAATAPLATPSFEDDDLSDWESTVDSVRTDKNARR